MENTCCFIGHSTITEDISQSLAATIERYIVEYKVTDFLVGNYGAFDRKAAAAIKAAKSRHPGIHLYLMLPYRPEQGRRLPNREGYDDFIYPEMEDVPLRVAIPRLNRIMVNESNFAIVYVRYSVGGAASTLEYARRKERKGQMHIENLAKNAI